MASRLTLLSTFPVEDRMESRLQYFPHPIGKQQMRIANVHRGHRSRIHLPARKGVTPHMRIDNCNVLLAITIRRRIIPGYLEAMRRREAPTAGAACVLDKTTGRSGDLHRAGED
jgi:hypothetical protein